MLFLTKMLRDRYKQRLSPSLRGDVANGRKNVQCKFGKYVAWVYAFVGSNLQRRSAAPRDIHRALLFKSVALLIYTGDFRGSTLKMVTFTTWAAVQ